MNAFSTISDYRPTKTNCDVANPAKSANYPDSYRSLGSKRMEQNTINVSKKILSTASPQVQELSRKRNEERNESRV